MQVILKQDVKGLGKKEDMVNVSDGYARNFLLPRNIAVEASKDNLNIMKTRKEAERTRKDREHAQAEDHAEKLAQINLVLKGKSGGTEGHARLFGSITSKDIADALKAQFRIDIDKKKIVLDEPIKTLGETIVDIKLYQGVGAKLRVTVEAE
ncbi:MAG: 50S ribosomal protein L9 [Clostridiales bacterium]|jgi:large subunit ribosomal protein L9|nr:50S ribosomal protein L9 [Clostridiales bacterium]